MFEHSRRRGVLIAGAILLSMFGAGCSNIEVNYAWSPRSAAIPLGDSFTRIVADCPDDDGQPPVDPRVQEMIRDMVEQGFICKGYEKRLSGPASFLVGCRMGKDVQGDKYSEENAQYTHGTLVVYVLDPESRKWLWRAWAETRLNLKAPPDKKKERLQETVDRMLERFPSRVEADEVED